MRKWITKHKYATLFILVSAVAMASGVPQQWATDNLRFGIPTSTDDKVIEINTGDGATNPKIVIDMVNKDFDFNKALNIVANQMSLGAGAAADQIFEFNIGNGPSNPKFRWSNAEQSIQFANDGVNYRNIGSGAGGGGGTNFLAELNADFEAGSPPNDWVNAGATFSTEDTTPLVGDQSGLWDPNVSGNTLDTALIALNTGFAGAVGQRCQVELLYKWVSGVSGEIQLKVQNQSSENIVILDLQPTTGDNSGLVSQQFDCPALADSLRIRIESTADAAPITLDQAFLGFGKDILRGGGMSLFGTSRWEGDTDCRWNVVANNTYESFPNDADCNDPSVTGKLEVPSTNTPSLQGTFTPGNYLILWNASFLNDSSAAENDCRLTANSGAYLSNSYHIFERSAGSADYESGTMAYNLTIPDHYTGQIEMECESNNAASTDMVINEDGRTVSVLVYKMPLNDAEAINLKTTGQNIWAGRHDESCLWQKSSTVLSEYTGDATCNLVERQSGLSVVSQADGTGPQPGIVFTSPITALYHICAISNFAGTSNTVGNIVLRDSNLVPIYEQAQRWQPNTASPGHTMPLCGFYRATAGVENTISIANRSDSGSITLSGQPVGGNFGSAIEWTIFPINQSFPTPVFTDLANSIDSKPTFTGVSGGEIVEKSIVFICNPTCTVFRERGGDWVSSITRTTTGDFTLNVNSGHFKADGGSGSELYDCSILTGAVGVTVGSSASIIALVNASLRFLITQEGGGASFDGTAFVRCWGEKP